MSETTNDDVRKNITRAQISQIVEEEMQDWLSDSDEVVWNDESVVDGMFERNVLVVDHSRQSVRILRAWAPYHGTAPDERPAVHVSIDLDKSFSEFSCDPSEINEMSFPHADTELDADGKHRESVFTKTFGGDVRFLWKNDQGRRTAFVGRGARVGQEECFFGGSAFYGREWMVSWEEMPLSHIAPARRAGHTR